MQRQIQRLARLEAVAPRGCATCRRWTDTVVMDDAGRVTRPPVCPACGRTVRIVTLVRLEGVPLSEL